MIRSAFSVSWLWRSREPAKAMPNPNYPNGIELNLAGPGDRACDLILAYPAPGVGTWVVTCNACGLTTAITAAGRRDDPRKVTLACKAIAN